MAKKRLKTKEDWQRDLELWQDLALQKGGFDPTKLTKDQKDLILEPSDAPENFMCDGEITLKQATTYWIKRMYDAGLTAEQIKLAIQYNNPL